MPGQPSNARMTECVYIYNESRATYQHIPARLSVQAQFFQQKTSLVFEWNQFRFLFPERLLLIFDIL